MPCLILQHICNAYVRVTNVQGVLLDVLQAGCPHLPGHLCDTREDAINQTDVNQRTYISLRLPAHGSLTVS